MYKGGGNMINPIRQKISFGASNTPQIYQNVAKTTSSVAAKVQQPEPENKKSVTETVRSAKNGLLNFFKGFNNVKDTTSGFIKGAKEGILTGALIGTIGANYIKSKEAITESLSENVKSFPVGRLMFKTVDGTIKDIFGLIKNAVLSIPKLYTQSPQANLKELFSKNPISSFFKYMKSSKLIAFTAVVAIAITAIRTIQGKINANSKNAELDHKLNEGHVPTK